MKKAIIFLIFNVIVFLPNTFSQNIPSSTRSREAIKKVKPEIKKELEQSGLKLGDPIYIRIFKKEKKLEVWVQKGKSFSLFKTYNVCTWGWGSLGPKLKQGDGQAPEGFYFIKPNQLNPYSSYHLAFNLGYPNSYDRANNRTGSALMVHGNCLSIGCYAMRDKNIEEIYTLADAALRGGQKYFRVHIFPFRMTNANMKEHSKSKWYSFWINLKEGYDIFYENKNIPPNVEVLNKKYMFTKT